MKHDNLFLLRCIFNSDDDCAAVEDIYAGYDESLDLVVLLEHTDYDCPEYDCRTYAVVGKDEAFELAKRLGVPMTRLPDVIGDSSGEGYRYTVNPTLRQTQDRFKEILEYLVAEKCRFRLERTYGRYGYCCF